MSLLEVDVDALQALITNLGTFENEVESLQQSLSSAYYHFDANFISPDKFTLESRFQALFQQLQNARTQRQELSAALNQLITSVREAEHLNLGGGGWDLNKPV